MSWDTWRWDSVHVIFPSWRHTPTPMTIHEGVVGFQLRTEFHFPRLSGFRSIAQWDL